MREHGTRAKYVVEKCRCEPCTVANRTYQRNRERNVQRARLGIEERVGTYIDAADTREYLMWLGSIGVGLRTVSDRTGIAIGTLRNLRLGRVTKCRPQTAAAVRTLGPKDRPSAALVPASLLQRRIEELQRQGWSKARIAQALGYASPALQFHADKVTVKNVRRVEALAEAVRRA